MYHSNLLSLHKRLTFSTFQIYYILYIFIYNSIKYFQVDDIFKMKMNFFHYDIKDLKRR